MLKILYIFGQMKKVNYFGYCYLLSVFTWSTFWKTILRGQTVSVLCSNVVWNPFLMKTTFTSDFSWFGSVSLSTVDSTSPLCQYSHKTTHSQFSLCQSNSPVSFQARVTEMNISRKCKIEMSANLLCIESVFIVFQ